MINQIKYAGIGSRATPPHILNIMHECGAWFAAEGYILSTGGATGADEAFKSGCDKEGGYLELYLPWKGYNKIQKATLSEPSVQAIDIAAQYHPAWHNCSIGVRKLHGRNAHILLGCDLNTPVDFVICWTKDGIPTGGTAMGIAIAEDNGIPVFNLGSDAGLRSLQDYLSDHDRANS